jgi:hypothetical protein
MAGFCEYCNEPSCCTKGMGFVTSRVTTNVFLKDSAPRLYLQEAAFQHYGFPVACRKVTAMSTSQKRLLGEC